MSTAASRRRLSDAIGSLTRVTGSPRLNSVLAEQAGVDLTFAAFRVLRQVVANGPLDLSRLATITNLAPNALSRQVKALEASGYIAREPHPGDRRIALVTATEAGIEAERRLMAANDRLLTRQLRHWTGAELDQLSASLERLAGDLRGSRT